VVIQSVDFRIRRALTIRRNLIVLKSQEEILRGKDLARPFDVLQRVFSRQKRALARKNMFFEPRTHRKDLQGRLA
jgi:hypothetical protein